MGQILFVVYGSLGDFYPYLAIALELKRRGYICCIATHKSYRKVIEGNHIEFHAIRPDLASDEVIRQTLDPVNGTENIIKDYFLPCLEESYNDIIGATKDVKVIISHPLAFAVSLIAEKQGIPWISTGLAPISFLSAYDPPVVVTRRGKFYCRFFIPYIYRLIIEHEKQKIQHLNNPINNLRSKLGLPKQLHPFIDGQHSLQLDLALFSYQFAKPQSDWTKSCQQTGFSFFESENSLYPLPEKFNQFLKNGEPPIVVTLGSAAIYSDKAENFFSESIIAAKLLNKRIILIGKKSALAANTLLSETSKQIYTCDYAPYEQVFPHCSVIVHHGGIGTTAQALRAGRPMLVVLFAYDQPDNAARASRLGLAETIDLEEYKAEKVVQKLRKLLKNKSYHRKAAEIGKQIHLENGTFAACDQIEDFLHEH